jgi:hypothetical protein
MFIIDITNFITLILLLICTILLIFLGHELKKSYITAIPLFAFLILLVIHVMQLMTLSVEYIDLGSKLSWCIVLDFAFILISFLSYLWVDDLEAKKMNKKSIDNSLDWFWKQI